MPDARFPALCGREKLSPQLGDELTTFEPSLQRPL
jgi:hypothetical protein